MPIFEVTDPNTGLTLELEGDSAPTEQELEQIFAQQVQTTDDHPSVDRPVIEKPVGSTAEGIIEPIKAITSGIVAEPLAGLSGLVTLPQGLDASGKAIKETREALTFKPKTQVGTEGLHTVGDLFKAGIDLANVPLSGLGGILELITGQGLDQATDTIRNIQKVGVSKALGERVFEETGSPEAAAIAESVPTAALEVAGFKGIQRGTKARPKQIAKQTDDVAGAVSVETAREASKQTGVGLFKAQQTLNPTDIERQAFVAQLPSGATQSRNALLRQNKEAAGAVDEFLGQLASPETVSTAGDKFRNASERAIDAQRLIRKEKASPLYKAAFEQGADVNLKPVNDFIDSQLLELPETGEIFKSLSKVKKLITGKVSEADGLTTTARPSLQKLHNAKLEIDQMIAKVGTDSLGNTTKAKLTEAKIMLVDQIKEASPLYDNALETFKAATPEFNKVNESIIGKIASYDDTQLKSIAQRLFDPSESNSLIIQQAKKVINNVDPDAWNIILRAELERRMGKVRADIGELSTSAALENIPAQLFNSIFGNKKSRDVLFNAVDGETKANLKFLETSLKRATKGRPGGSQTAIRAEIAEELKGGAVQSIRDFIRSPLTKTGAVGEEAAFNRRVKALSHVLFDPSWKKEMTKVRNLPQGSTRAKKIMDDILNGALIALPIADTEDKS